jgi:hypothetical protein
LKRTKRLYKAKQHKKTLSFLIKNLLIAHFEQRPLRISRNKSNYSKNTRYGKMHLTYQVVTNITQALEELEYIKHDKGFYNHDNNYGRETRITAAPKLYMKIAKYEELKKPGCFKLVPPEKLIILRDNKEDITFKHIPETLMMEKDMKQYNQFVDDHKITIEFDRNSTINNGFLTEHMMKNLYSGRMVIDQVLINKNQKYLNHPSLSCIDKPTQTNQYKLYPETDYLSEIYR